MDKSAKKFATETKMIAQAVLDRIFGLFAVPDITRAASSLVNTVYPTPVDVARLLATTRGVRDIDDLKREMVGLLLNAPLSTMHLESGLKVVEIFCPEEFVSLTCDFLRAYECLFFALTGDDRLQKLLIATDCLERRTITPDLFGKTMNEALTATQQHVQRYWCHECWIISGLKVFGDFAMNWTDLRRKYDESWEKPWWWAVVDVSRLLANGARELAVLRMGDGEYLWQQSHNLHDVWIQRRFAAALLHWLDSEIGGLPLATACGTSEAISWMLGHGITPATQGERPGDFEKMLGDICLSKAGNRRTIEGYGFLGPVPVYIVRKHETNTLERKRLQNPNGSKVGYGPTIRRDKEVVDGLLPKPR